MKNRYKHIALYLLVIALFYVQQVQAQQFAALPAERRTITQHIISDRPLLVELLTTAGLIPILSSDAPYTLLAPPEETLRSYKEESPQKLRALLSEHIIKGIQLEKDFKDGADVETLAGTKVRICRKKGRTLVNGVAIVNGDNSVRNGVVHGLNGAMQR